MQTQNFRSALRCSSFGVSVPLQFRPYKQTEEAPLTLGTDLYRKPAPLSVKVRKFIHNSIVILFYLSRLVLMARTQKFFGTGATGKAKRQHQLTFSIQREISCRRCFSNCLKWGFPVFYKFHLTRELQLPDVTIFILMSRKFTKINVVKIYIEDLREEGVEMSLLPQAVCLLGSLPSPPPLSFGKLCWATSVNR